MRRLNDRMLMMLIAMFMSWGLSAFANSESGEWAVNPADYRYDMSLYFNVSLKASESMDSFEVGAFVGDECRGVAETLELPENGECGYLRIHSNASKSENEVIELKIRDKRSGAVRQLTAKDGSSMMFEPDVMTGLPSEPYILYRCYNVSITGVENGTVDFNNGQYPENKELSIEAVPSEGYHFEHWSDGVEDAKRVLVVTDDLELSPVFAANLYKIVFKIGEEVISEETVAYGEAVKAPEAPAKEGYAFSGWDNLPETMPAGDLEIVGNYTVNSYKLVFKIGEEVISEETVAYGEAVKAPEAPAKEGYTFAGWENVPETMPASDLEIFG
ncbi:MAG: InlB B-repeat-containing protein, partial [Muribaculaceae bacterium]|nr:InlB B-repeat-containing protein [Muribaculaceae bacterium]